MKLNFRITGAIVTKEDMIIIWGENNIIKVSIHRQETNRNPHNNQSSSKDHEILEEYKLKKISLVKIFIGHEYMYFVLRDGKIVRNKNINIEEGLAKALDFQTTNQLDISNRTTALK